MLRLGAIAVVLLFVVHLAVEWVLRHQVEQLLHPEPGDDTYLGEVHLNLFSGLATVKGITLSRAGEPYLELGHLLLDVSPMALLKGKVHVERVELFSGRWQVVRRADGSIDPGMTVPATEDEPAAEPLPVQLDQLRIRDFSVVYRDELVSLEQPPLRIHDLTLQQLTLPASGEPATLLGAVGWGKAAVELDARINPQTQPEVDAQLQLKQIPLGLAAALATRQSAPYAGALDSALKLALKQGQLHVAGDSGLKQFAFKDAQWDLRGEHVKTGAWQATVDIEAASLLAAQLNGVNLAGLSLAGPDLVLQLGEAGLSGAIAVDQAANSVKAAGLNLKLAKVDLKQGETSLGLDKLALADIGLELPLDKPDQGKLSLNSLGLQAVRVEQGAQQVALASLDLSGRWLVDLAQQTLQGNKSKLQGKTLLVKQDDLSLSVAALNGDITLPSSAFDNPSLKGALAVNSIKVQHPAVTGGELSLAELKLEGLNLADQVARLSDLTLQQLAWTHHPLQLQRLQLGASSFSASDTQMGQLTLTGLQGTFTRNQQSEWLLPVVAPATEEAASQPTDAPDTSATEAPAASHFALAGLTLKGDNRLRIVDESLKPSLKQDLTLETLTLGAMDSRKPDAKTPLTLKVSPDKYTVLDMKAMLKPLASDFYISAQGALSGLELAIVNPMIGDELGHQFLGGHLDDTFELTIDKGQMEMSNDLELVSLEVEEIEGKEGPPLSMAIGLLEDRDGKITLGVPVKGDLNNPDFSVLGALNPIIMKAVAGTAALAIQPLGSVLLVGGLLANEALKVSFEPALFDAKSTRPSGKTAENVKALAAKLAEKPKLKLRLCGLAVVADRSRDKKGNFTDSEAQLLKLADQRAAAVRSLLLKGGVSEQQLRRCRPKLDDKAEAKPRVDIKL